MKAYEPIPQISDPNDTLAAEREALYTELFGPIIGTFTPEVVTGGYRPDDPRTACGGIVLPIRQQTIDVVMGGSFVLVSAREALDILVAKGRLASNPVRGFELATFSFPRNKGELNLYETSQ
jgi:hypothetical protein